MPNAKDLTVSYLKALFIGKNGSWKSSCAASFPKPIYVFDFDSRIGALRGQDVDYDTFNWKDSGGWWGPNGPEKKIEYMLTLAKSGKFPYKTVLVSSITSLTDYFSAEATKWMSGKVDEKGDYSGRRIGPTQYPEKQLVIPDQGHFRFCFQATKELLATFLTLPCNLIVEAHEVSTYDFEEKEWKGKKLMTIPSLIEYIPTKFDECWNFETSESALVNIGGPVKYTVRFHGAIAKTTFRNLPQKPFEIKDSATFYDAIMKEFIEKEKYVKTL